MYIQDDICYVGNAEACIKILSAEVRPDKKLLITFSTGEKRVFNPAILKGNAFSLLENEKIALNPSIFHGILTWDEGNIDIAPETVYKESVPLFI